MRIPTPWSNNDVKTPASFSPVPRVSSQWTNNDVKVPAVFIPTEKSHDAWGVNFQAPQTYFYNDPHITYNSSLVAYNYLVNANQLNQRNRTLWEES
jgi:hypothetical protein